MRIAVTHENGNVFPHFGKAREFKVYEVTVEEISTGEVLTPIGEGHAAMAQLMVENAIDVVLCGGIGEEAMNALAEVGIEVVSGVEGEADSAVEAYLNDQLSSAGTNCGCGGNCGDGEGCGCGGGCGGCGGGCGGGMRVILEGKNAGKTCRVHYRGTFNDGTQFDASYDRGEALEFVCGTGMMIPGFDKAVVNMNVGEAVDIHLMPEDAYGPLNSDAILTIEIAQLPGSENLTVGQRVFLSNAYGQPVPVKVTGKTDTMITLDANHEMAGKELNFHIELVEVL